MARLLCPCLMLLLVLIFRCRAQSGEDGGYISVEVSNRGLDFVKDLLIREAESSIVPLKLPEIEKSVKIPIVGRVDVELSNIVIEEIHVSSSTVKIGDTGIVIDVSGATANMSMNWKYSYSTWLLPVSVSDHGNATIQVKGLEVGLTFSLKTENGSLKLSLLECGFYVNGISIKLDGGASWLYQGMIDAFESNIGSAVESAVPKKIKDAVVKLDSFLQSLPQEVPVTDVAALNVTFVNDPLLSESSLVLKIDGLFSAKTGSALSRCYHRILPALFSHNQAEKMAKISVHEAVLKSASSVYFEANKMHWVVDQLPEQSLLNTAGWRFIIPQLYRMYPNCEMNLNLSVSTSPTIEVEKEQIRTVVPLDMVIDVLNAGEVIPVACITTVISSSASAEISGNALTGFVKLNDLNMSLKWSKIGGLHMHLIQALVSTTLRTVVFPYINIKLSQGYQIPAFHGYTLDDTQMFFTDSWIVVGTDVRPVEPFSCSVAIFSATAISVASNPSAN